MKTSHLLSAFLTLSIAVSFPVTTGSGKSVPPASFPSTASTGAPHRTDSSGQRVAVSAVQLGAFSAQENAILEIRRIEEPTGIRGILREQMIWRRK